MSKTKLGQVVFPPKDFELIEEITLEGAETVVKRTGLNLLKMELFITTQAATAAAPYAVEIRNGAGLFGYIWGGNAIGASVMNLRISAESGDKPFATLQRYGQTNQDTTVTAVYGLPTFKDGGTPISALSIYTSGSGVTFPAGTTFKIYGIRKE